MSSGPSSDLIIDVMRQADPVKVREAAERLSAIGRSAGVSATPEDFTALVHKAISDAKGGGWYAHSVAAEASAPTPSQNAMVRAKEKMSPGQQLESFVLTNLVETMMPKDAESVFGSGTAGSFWRSMLAEKLAAELTMAGGVGLREQLKLREVDGPSAAETIRSVLEASKARAQAMAANADAVDLGAFAGAPDPGATPAASPADEAPSNQHDRNGA